MSNKPKHYSRGYIESERLRAQTRGECGAFFFILLAFLIVCVIANQYDSENFEEENKVMQAKYDKWVAYREKNCKLKEQLFGIRVGEGKFSHTANANSYECNNGMKYTIETAHDTGKILTHNVPDVK